MRFLINKLFASTGALWQQAQSYCLFDQPTSPFARSSPNYYKELDHLDFLGYDYVMAEVTSNNDCDQSSLDKGIYSYPCPYDSLWSATCGYCMVNNWNLIASTAT